MRHIKFAFGPCDKMCNFLLAYLSRNEQSTISCINIRVEDSSSVADVSRLLYTLASSVTNFVHVVNRFQ
ncbi:hypothetical protein CISIN_1g035309mg [Citrus sinensis]|uniref:Uncharacterized protein n=1 Tax=Citrus sinensis TaxID=2711 RepID=A0A067DW25_CITSI|nr:hypothetical protein CISIN_1g035309mg [Citrus sinensis]